MSWTVYLMRAAGFDSVRDIPEGWSPPPLGPREAVAARLRALLPSLCFTRRSCATYRGEGFSLEFNLGESEQTAGILLLVHGTDEEELLDVIGQVAEALEVRALASGLGDFMRFTKDADSGRHIWRDAPHADQWVAPP
jgi:hypothetical protein